MPDDDGRQTDSHTLTVVQTVVPLFVVETKPFVSLVLRYFFLSLFPAGLHPPFFWVNLIDAGYPLHDDTSEFESKILQDPERSKAQQS